ncbi:MAG: hypothetical protein PHT40_00195 [Patescibacteria group bacterium]|nr:hypothetical protein [Patescibacteria group bacterium]
MSNILLLSTDLEKFSYLMEKGGFGLTTFADQKEKAIPENWPVDFVEYKGKNSTLDILMDEKIKEIKEKTGARLVYVFKNSFLIEKELAKLDFSPLNPPAELTEKIEGKISQADFFPEIKEFFPEFIIAKPGEKTWEEIKKELGENLIAQFNTSHSGAGTFELSENLWQEWQKKFPHRPIRISKFIVGETLTLNLVVLPTAIILGVPSKQLTGTPGLTEHKFTTVGNAWITFDGETKNQMETIAKGVGAILQKNNFFGPAGLDLIVEKIPSTDVIPAQAGIQKNGSWIPGQARNDSSGERKTYLIEINARQPASFNLESWLAKLANRKGLFDYLVDFWQGKILPAEMEPLAISGGQIVVRAKSDWCGIIKSTPKTGVYGLDNGQLVLVTERLFLASKNEFLAHFCPIGRQCLPGGEVFRVQTGKNFIDSNGGLSEEILTIIEKLKKEIIFY